MSKTTQSHQVMYAKRMQQVCDYIYTHLETDLSLEKVSEVAYFSKFHFHRQFAAYTGLTLHQFIQQARLKRACYHLAFNPQLKIIDIALEARFESGEAFARAFKKQFDVSPSHFRKQPAWKPWHETYQLPKETVMKTSLEVEIIDFPETRIAVLEHHGDPGLINHSVAKFIEWRRSSGLSPLGQSRTFSIPYQNPDEVAPTEFQCDICGSEERPIPENLQGVVSKALPGGRCARVRHYGSHNTMNPTIYALYRDWLPQSGEQPRGDFPCFFEYHNFLPQVAESELITDIYLPLQ